jgi:hypothetical protein
VGAVLLGAAGAPAQEPLGESDWRIDRFDERVDLAAGAAVAVENLVGEIRVRVGDASELDLHAIVQRHAKDSREPRVAVSDGPVGKRVVASFAEGNPGAPLPELDRRRIDIVVTVPPGTALDLRSDAGLIEVKGAVGDLAAESIRGDLRLWVERSTRARTERGSISAFLLGDGWSQSATFETLTGAIEVELPATADVDLRLETTGRISTDYTVAVEWTGRRHKLATGRVGEGGPEVLLRSENGPVAVLRRMPGGSGAALEVERHLR